MRHKGAKTTQIYADHLPGDDEAAVVEAAFAVRVLSLTLTVGVGLSADRTFQSPSLVEVLDGDRAPPPPRPSRNVTALIPTAFSPLGSYEYLLPLQCRRTKLAGLGPMLMISLPGRVVTRSRP